MRKQLPSRKMFAITVAAVLSACGSGEKDFQVISTIDAPNHSIILEFAPSELAFGPADIRVSTQDGDSLVVHYEGRISNDGGDITLDNLRPNTSTQGHLWMCLNGVEQGDLIVRIDFAAELVIEEERHCAY